MSRSLAENAAAIKRHLKALADLRAERKRMRHDPREGALDAAHADLAAGMSRVEAATRNGLTIGQIAGVIARRGWRFDHRRKHGRKEIITGERLAQLKAAYENPALKVADTAKAFGLRSETVHRYAHRHGWARPKIRSLHPLQRATYKKMRPVVGRAVALAEAHRVVIA